MSQYSSLLIGIVSAGLMIVSRLITNHHCKMRGREMLAAGTTSGFIPPWVSAVYVVATLGVVVAFIWSFSNVGWWGPLFVVALYLATGFVRSRAHDINLAIRFNQRTGV
jgi:hypothetical protein